MALRRSPTWPRCRAMQDEQAATWGGARPGIQSTLSGVHSLEGIAGRRQIVRLVVRDTEDRVPGAAGIGRASCARKTRQPEHLHASLIPYRFTRALLPVSASPTRDELDGPAPQADAYGMYLGQRLGQPALHVQCSAALQWRHLMLRPAILCRPACAPFAHRADYLQRVGSQLTYIWEGVAACDSDAPTPFLFIQRVKHLGVLWCPVKDGYLLTITTCTAREVPVRALYVPSFCRWRERGRAGPAVGTTRGLLLPLSWEGGETGGDATSGGEQWHKRALRGLRRRWTLETNPHILEDEKKGNTTACPPFSHSPNSQTHDIVATGESARNTRTPVLGSSAAAPLGLRTQQGVVRHMERSLVRHSAMAACAHEEQALRCYDLQSGLTPGCGGGKYIVNAYAATPSSDVGEGNGRRRELRDPGPMDAIRHVLSKACTGISARIGKQEDVGKHYAKMGARDGLNGRIWCLAWILMRTV
ncbi:hypothetical protein BJ912DRAFT_1049130 [Pholiota molesta]|nr:hypothetical protein BJ912DRAFT_1049130 [Pholiota molesta]